MTLCQRANGGAPQETMGSQQLTQGNYNDVASTSKQEPGNFGSGIDSKLFFFLLCLLEVEELCMCDRP